MLASLLPLVPQHHLDGAVGDHEVRFDDYEDRFDSLKAVNEIEFVSKRMSFRLIFFNLLIGLVGRYLTVTICGEACPCPHFVVVTLFWIGN